MFRQSGSAAQPGSRRHQDGYILLMLMFAVLLISFVFLAALPSMVTQIKRDKEDELIHRGTEYARAVKKFYRKNRRYPAKIEDLENTNNVRYLRRRYKDPMTKSGNWKFLTQADVMQATSNANFMGGGIPPLIGNPLQPSLSGASPEPSPTPSPSPTSGGFGSPTSAPLGGGGIWGVASTNTGKSLHEFGKKANYNKWLFIYDVNQDVQQAGGLPRLLKGPYNPMAFKPSNNLNPQDPNNPSANPSPTPSGLQ